MLEHKVIQVLLVPRAMLALLVLKVMLEHKVSKD